MDPLLSKLSSHLKNVIARAISAAAALKHEDVAPAHLLLALMEEQGSIGHQILKKAGIDREALIHAVSSLDLRSMRGASGGNSATITLPSLNDAGKKTIEKGMLIAYEHESTYIGTEHLLAGIIEIDDDIVNDIFDAQKIDVDAMCDQIDTIIHTTGRFPDLDDMSEVMDQLQPPMGELLPLPQIGTGEQKNNAKKDKKEKPAARGSRPTALDVFTVDLTREAAQKNIDPVIGREAELERLTHILGRRNKNNPVLVGEPGVGKTAIVEGLAKRIAEGAVPDTLKHKRILSLDLTLLIAGTIYRGEFEARLKQVIDEVQANDSIILFIDEIHNIIGAGSNQGTMDAANILKPALARGSLRCIGATTHDEYKKYIMSDPALERRFQSIQVGEPNRDEAVAILSGVKKNYESFHHVVFPKETIEAAVDLSLRYVHDNCLPDKAIDLLDEAAASVKTKQKLSEEEREVYALTREYEQCLSLKENAIRSEHFEEATDLKKKQEQLEKKIEAAKKNLASSTIPRKKVTPKDIAFVVGRKLNIDPYILLQDAWQQLEMARTALKQNILGQDAVADRIIDRLQHAHLGLSDSRRPFASFLFVGPSGVGKTKLAESLAKALYHDEKALIRLDMTEFAEQHGISKLLGSPAGYIGHKERNRFTDEITRRPYAVLLFDEADKAHPDVMRLLLQILDEGTLTDSAGKKIHFNHATIILTSTIGASLYKQGGIGFGAQEKKITVGEDLRRSLKEELKAHFGAELVGRIDDLCFFEPLKKETLNKIIEHRADTLNRTLKKSNLSIMLKPESIESIIKEAWNDDTGARTLEQTVDRVIGQAAAEALKKKRRKKAYMVERQDEKYVLT